MFVITFYSYKGGVGRTMALMNTAAELTKRGRRVLILDFDLEAPGISTYRPFQHSSECPGIVDYVSEFAETLKAPNASDFIVECSFSTDGEIRPVWAFPAGRRGESYGAKLASIDWQDLYVNRDGYLLFEDLRQQLKDDHRNFDYVLVDSRTGYTDVGGICTRQLADVVVVMFFPNEQNIFGLESIASEIRIDSLIRSRKTELLFVPSNVPDLDDEEGILKHMMELASERLKYDEASAVIHHYDSMSLIDQSIFTLSRPNSRLAEEYRGLTKSIVQLNIEDREGALSSLQRLRRHLEYGEGRNGRRRADSKPWDTKTIGLLDEIGRIHSADGEVAWVLATVYKSLGNLSNELNALNDALTAGYNSANVHLRRAFNLMSQSRVAEARDDLLAVVASETTRPIELTSAIEALRAIDPDWYRALEVSPALLNLESSDLSRLSEVLMTETNGLKIAYKIFERSLINNEQATNDFVRNHFALTLIGLGQFADAVSFISSDRSELVSGGDTPAIFNFAMAEWGLNGTPPYELITYLVSSDKKEISPHGANYFQCLALCYALSDDYTTARSYIANAKRSLGPGRIFSSWRYRYVDRDSMIEDLEEMDRSLQAGQIKPPFLNSNREYLH
ncbi:MAG: hypothetical protein E5X23_27990 [Mesorhizobium sp.]|uniref:ParA family protein n=1 Tax=unclassified Mesorhizobium TaxID=325217 RepID=UPI000F75E789|nr:MULTISPECIES: ParA family protein [unclassified Mesorhizobium]TGV94490.1 hypothetical protein EN801_002340 [Mesorhizobium sp. M00.F.Ca.ET.158.01.1.1]AZO60376.1 hypothetical protein EJ078_14890 [Mesorhizobium sp. M1A.F.Ca.IN.022.06.1.1]MCT2576079.1 AAA family ATPase [Mesorhizobium sp. P13.3]MDF3164989.1 AAA family ATPase [Mesorhizobium sp. P16.1]MDF3176622.1 AAA family ATPase [Mesorhizobium sp. P17.1]